MTSELKPCHNCGGKNQSWSDGLKILNGIQQNRLNTNDIECFFHLGCEDCGETLKMVSAEKIAEMLNTRAVPDVPGLVTVAYGVDENNMGKPLVRRDKAAEIIAAIRSEMMRAQDADAKAFLAAISRAEAAEAKLAQYEAQEAVGYLTEDDLTWLNDGNFSINKVMPRESICFNKPVYTSPAPAADLKAKCDRYEQTLRGIAELSATDMSYGDQVFAVTSSRAALNPSEPRT